MASRPSPTEKNGCSKPGRIELRQCQDRDHPDLNENEFRVFSQFGEDGIIQFLLTADWRRVPERFIEFGVEDYQEANTRFLLFQRYWSGLVIDGSSENVDRIHRSGICWARTLTALSSFVTTENINQLITNAGFSGPLGLLSVDIDGNDYWVWKAINCVDCNCYLRIQRVVWTNEQGHHPIRPKICAKQRPSFASVLRAALHSRR